MKELTKKQILNSFVLFVFLLVMTPVPDLLSNFGQLLSMPAPQSWIENTGLFHDNLSPFYRGWSFLLVGIVIFINSGDFKSLNIDSAFMVIFLLSGIIYSIYNFWPSGWLVAILLIFTIIYSGKKGIKFGETNYKAEQMILVILIGFFVGLIFLSNSIDIIKIRSAIHWFVTQLPGVSLEEFLFRGLFWMVFKNFNWRESGILILQAVVFWLFHVTYMFSQPFTFWVVVPLGSFIFGIIAWRYKSIGTSTTAHILINVLLGLK